MNAIPHETQEQLGPATVGGLAKPAFEGAVRLSQRATMKAAVRDRYGALASAPDTQSAWQEGAAMERSAVIADALDGLGDAEHAT